MSQNYKEVRNLRRKAERRIASLKKQKTAANSALAKKQIQRDIRRMQEAVRGTRTYSVKTGKRIHSAAQVERGISKLRNIVNEYPLRGISQRNRLFSIRMNLASSQSFQGPTVNKERTVGEEISGLTRAQVKVFFRATQKAWDKPGVPVEHRIEAIIDYYKGEIGTTDLKRIFNYVLSDQRNKDVAKANDILANPENYTDGERKWAYEVLADNDAEVRYMQTVTAAAVTDVSPVAPM